MDLPIDILIEIAHVAYPIYLLMKCSWKHLPNKKEFDLKYDYMISIGYTITITKDKIEWVKNGKYHRKDGPAIEYATGDKGW